MPHDFRKRKHRTDLPRIKPITSFKPYSEFAAEASDCIKLLDFEFDLLIWQPLLSVLRIIYFSLHLIQSFEHSGTESESQHEN